MHHFSIRFFMAFLLSGVGLASTASGQSVADAASQLEFFEKSIRPLLVEKCHKCHGAQKQWNGLRLDSRDAILRGGDSGAAMVVGDPDNSAIIKAVRHVDPEQRMPPKDQLNERQIADLVQWIRGGAIFPETAPHVASAEDHWAFRPRETGSSGPHQGNGWALSWIDAWILSALRDQQLHPADEAKPWQLLRRATFDLIGLPPGSDDLLELETSQLPDQYERHLDRLLASSSYGERWGRHWLDVARYADSNGLDENVAFGNAWRYRDYVVLSLNRDKSFVQFLTEQIAGDLLPATDDATRHEQLTATGFLAIGPKVLAEVDEAKMQMDIVDEQIETFGRVFLGMTLGCARCHDHKFDPVSTQDYYALAGVFKSTRTMDTYTKVARWHENPLDTPELAARKSAFDSQLQARKDRLQEALKAAAAEARQKPEAKDLPEKDLEAMFPEVVRQQLKTIRDEITSFEATGPVIPTAMGVAEDVPVDMAVHIRGSHLKLGEKVPRGIPRILAGSRSSAFESAQSGRWELSQWLTDPSNPLTSRVFVNRVWRWHFGRGLVGTTDNFGVLGERPSHPELLDQIAQRFLAGGGSWKRLHRWLMTSATYRQSSIPASANQGRDPENRYFSRASVRRLEAESIRDGMLFVSESLDNRIGGSLLTVKNREYFFDHTSKDLTSYQSPRRSVYLPIVRNNVYDVFQLLDYPDAAVPNGDRNTTTIAPQALWMMNSDFVFEVSRDLATRALQQPSSDRERVHDLILRMLTRRADSQEENGWLSFLEKLEQMLKATESDADLRRQKAWIALCQTMLSSNEFIYVP